MRRLIISVLGASTVAIATPAAAQYQQQYQQQYRNNNYGYGYQQQQGQQIQQRIYQLRERLQRVTQRGRVSRNESIRLQRELYQIERLYNQYARNGLNQREQYDLQLRIQRLQQQIREDRQDGRQYNDGRGYDDGRYNDDRRYDRRDRDGDDYDDD